MKYADFLERVQGRADIADDAQAERTVVTVLQELLDRISAKEGHDLLAQLPYELKRSVTVTVARVPLSPDEFVARVARELDVTEEEARRRIRAVFGTLREAVTWGELEDVLLELDPEYADLLA
ncbi:MAG: hypothetical protein QOE13_1768 [Gaiellaceae bacterium]|jgi:uncharacterized protein (DUF2267 family)|nr:hypothetical protein [Gaiellaceae bacterium]